MTRQDKTPNEFIFSLSYTWVELYLAYFMLFPFKPHDMLFTRFTMWDPCQFGARLGPMKMLNINKNSKEKIREQKQQNSYRPPTHPFQPPTLLTKHTNTHTRAHNQTEKKQISEIDEKKNYDLFRLQSCIVVKSLGIERLKTKRAKTNVYNISVFFLLHDVPWVVFLVVFF